jgi:hypothetical protein
MIETRLVVMPTEIEAFFKGLAVEAPDLTLRDAPSRWCVSVNKKVEYPTPVIVLLGGKLVGVVGWRRIDETLNVLILLSGMDAPLIAPTSTLPNHRPFILTYIQALRLGLRIENEYGIPLADKIKVVPFRVWGFDVMRVDGFNAEVRLQRAWELDTPFVKIIVRPEKAVLEAAMWAGNNFVSLGVLPITASEETLKEWIKDVVLNIYLQTPTKGGVTDAKP